MSAPPIVVRFTPDGAASVEAAIVRTEQAAAKAAAATKTQMDKVAKATADVAAQAAKASDAMGARIAGGARQASFALEGMARSGNIAGEGLRQLLAIGADIAFAFGPAGAVAGAIGATALAVVAVFKRANDELTQTRQRFNDQLSGLIDDGNLAGVRDQAAKLWRGVFDPATGAFENGVGALLQRRQQIQFDPNQLFRDVVLKKFDERIVRINGEEIAVKDLIARYEQLAAVLRNPPQLPRPLGTAPITITSGGGTGSGTSSAPPPPTAAELALARRGAPRAGSLLSLPALDLTALSTSGIPGLEALRAKGLEQLTALRDDWAREAQAIGGVFTNAFADGLATAIAQLDIGAGFRVLTAGVLAGIGSLMIQTGQAMVTFGKLIEAFKRAVLSLTGGNVIATGLILVASGALLQGFAGRLGNAAPRIAGGGDRNLGGGFGVPGTAAGDRIPVGLPRQPWENQAAGMGPVTPRSSVVWAGNVFGPKDPSLPRYLFEAIEEGVRRGFKLPAGAVATA